MEHILITDDNSEYRAEIIELLEGEGYTLTGAANGEEALAKITVNPPDLILCDIDMPMMNGLDVLRRVRATPATAHIPFILITGRTDDASLNTATELGVTDYITKPMNIDHLLTKIQQVLNPEE